MQLYLRKHNVTGMKYLGWSKDPNARNYEDRESVWSKHLKEHGNDYTTEILFESEDPNEVTTRAVGYSIANQIWDNPKFANQMLENARTGSVTKRWRSKEMNAKLAQREQDIKNDPVKSEARRKNQSASQTKAQAEFSKHPEKVEARRAKKSVAAIKTMADINADPVRQAHKSRKLSEAHKGIPKPAHKDGGNPAARPVKINGVVYGCLKEAVETTGDSSYKIRKWCKDINNTNYKYL